MDDDSTFDSFAPVVGRGFVEHSVQQPVQPRMHFLLALARSTCAHTDSAVSTDAGGRRGGGGGGARYTLSQNFTAAHDRHNVCRLLIVGRHARETSIISKTKKKKSHESIVTAEKVSFFYAVVRLRPRIFRHNRPRYIKMHEDDNFLNHSRQGTITSFLFRVTLLIFDLDWYSFFRTRLRINISYMQVCCLSYARMIRAWCLNERENVF